MTSPAVFPADDLIHRYVIPSGFHLYAEFHMTHGALKPDPVEPVGKDHR